MKKHLFFRLWLILGTSGLWAQTSQHPCPGDLSLSAETPSMERPLFFETEIRIISSAVITAGNSVTYDAGTMIRLTPGFRAAEGSSFRAVIDGCGGEQKEWLAKDENQFRGSPPHESPADDPENPAGRLTLSPNPFSDQTTVNYSLAEGGQVSLQVFDATGKLVRTLVAPQWQEAGDYWYRCEGSDLSPGIYFLTLQRGGQYMVERLVRTH